MGSPLWEGLSTRERKEFLKLELQEAILRAEKEIEEKPNVGDFYRVLSILRHRYSILEEELEQQRDT